MDVHVGTTGGQGHELVAELRRLAERFPIPDPSWHGYVPELRGLAADLAAAAAALESLPAASGELERRLEADEDADVDHGGGSLGAAAARLRSVPVPAGEHPFLDEIAVTVDAARHALAALASVAGGAEAFAAARAR